MIIGHIGVAFAAKRQWSRVSLGALLVATFAPDLVRVGLGAAGLPMAEANFYSHALPWSVLLAVAAGALAWATWRDGIAAMVVGALVLSHVALDFISGHKPLWRAGPMGIDVGSFEQLELVIEAALLIAGWLLLRRVRDPSWTRSRSVPVLLILVQAASAVGSISQRPYRTRCLAYPVGACTDGSMFTRRWNAAPFW